MFPSSTVENYIKVIHAQQVRLSDPDGLVPMGHLAMGMGVTPGTATTMVKALADSGLVHYAPYAGVRLTRAGERLAGRVIRRHRLMALSGLVEKLAVRLPHAGRLAGVVLMVWAVYVLVQPIVRR